MTMLMCRQLCGDMAKDLKSMDLLISRRPIDESVSLWLEVGAIKPVFRLYTAVAELISLQQNLSKVCVATIAVIFISK